MTSVFERREKRRILVAVVVEHHVVVALRHAVDLGCVRQRARGGQHAAHAVALAHVVAHEVGVHDGLGIVAAGDGEHRVQVLVAQVVLVGQHVRQRETRLYAVLGQERERLLHLPGRGSLAQERAAAVQVARGKAAVHAVDAHAVLEQRRALLQQADEEQVEPQPHREIRQRVVDHAFVPPKSPVVRSVSEGLPGARDRGEGEGEAYFGTRVLGLDARSGARELRSVEQFRRPTNRRNFPRTCTSPSVRRASRAVYRTSMRACSGSRLDAS